MYLLRRSLMTPDRVSEPPIVKGEGSRHRDVTRKFRRPRVIEEPDLRREGPVTECETSESVYLRGGHSRDVGR